MITTFACVICRSKSVINASEETKTFIDALPEIKINHLPSYKIGENPEYAYILKEMQAMYKEANKKMDEPENGI